MKERRFLITKGMISIIIPVYNRAYCIARTLDTIQSQTYSNWECIVVDDGSNDDTMAIVQDYCTRDVRFRLYSRPGEYKNGGRGAKNFGFTISRGEFINFFDSDDLMLPEFLERKVDVLEKDSNLDFVGCNFFWKVRSGEYERSFYYSKNILKGEDFWLDYLKMAFFVSVPVPLWRRKFLKSKSLWDEDTVIGEDWEFHARMLLDDARFKIIDERLWKYVANEESMMSDPDLESVGSRAFARIKVFRELNKRTMITTRLSLVEFRWQSKIIRQITEVLRDDFSYENFMKWAFSYPKHLRLAFEVIQTGKLNSQLYYKLVMRSLLFLISGKGHMLLNFSELGENDVFPKFNIK